MEGADLVVGGGGLAAVGVLVVVAGRGGGTVARAKAVGKFGGALVEVGAIEGGGVPRTTRDFKSGRKGDLRPGRKSRRQKRGKKDKSFFIGFPREPHG